MSERKVITVTSPLLPPLEELLPYFRDIWKRKWLTNNGHYHRELEQELASFLGVPHLCLFSNGTLALMAALRALDVTGEVITTPYSFVASAHAIWWSNARPVFADVDPQLLNLDPRHIESSIGPETTAIVPVHVYGNPCDTRAIDDIAGRHGLKTIYDAAHAFGVAQDGVSLLNRGDASVLSFHATKSFSTIEGGAVVARTEETQRKLERFRNFGFESELAVAEHGINAKLNEVQAAYGLVCLKHFSQGVRERKRVSDLYRRELGDVRGIRLLPQPPGVSFTYSYFPIFVDETVYGRSRDELYEDLRAHDILGRRYFYPLISDFAAYRHLPSAARSRLAVAAAAADQVICLPIFAELDDEDARRVVTVIKT